MAALSSKQHKTALQKAAENSVTVIKKKAAHELFFALVGPVGAGSSLVARQLIRCLQATSINGVPFKCETVKAGTVIREWAENEGTATSETKKPSIDQKIVMQELGDRMREARDDNAAVAVGLIEQIAKARARALKQPFVPSQPVEPDGNPRAYVLDSLKHPAEALLLRRLYGDAFVLIGVVCSEPVRRQRLEQYFFTKKDLENVASKEKVRQFMDRDADDRDRDFGQHVTDTFQEADFFVDNTRDINLKPGEKMEDVADPRLIGELTRLVDILVHKRIIRPTIDETAMHTAFSAKLRSSCLSRQVGAALLDRHANVVATGTNEVPRAGGGVYGEQQFGEAFIENRCALCEGTDGKPYCSNNRYQNNLINQAIDALFDSTLTKEKRDKHTAALRRTQAGQLLEFSRSVHAEMDALLSAARSGISPVGSRLFVTTFPCHYCARHIVSAGVYEVQYIEPYPKSQALQLHGDAIELVPEDWIPPSESTMRQELDARKKRDTSGSGATGKPAVLRVGAVAQGTPKVLFRPFVGVAPRLYERVFLKDREYKNKVTGAYQMGEPRLGSPWAQHQVSYARLEAELAKAATTERGQNG